MARGNLTFWFSPASASFASLISLPWLAFLSVLFWSYPFFFRLTHLPRIALSTDKPIVGAVPPKMTRRTRRRREEKEKVKGVREGEKERERARDSQEGINRKSPRERDRVSS